MIKILNNKMLHFLFSMSMSSESEPPGKPILGGAGLVAKLCPTLETPRTMACQAPLSIGFSRKNTGIGFHFLLQGIFLTQD